MKMLILINLLLINIRNATSSEQLLVAHDMNDSLLINDYILNRMDNHFIKIKLFIKNLSDDNKVFSQIYFQKKVKNQSLKIDMNFYKQFNICQIDEKKWLRLPRLVYELYLYHDQKLLKKITGPFQFKQKDFISLNPILNVFSNHS